MSTINYIPTKSLRVGDTLLIDASMVGVAGIERDEFDDDAVWLSLDCFSGDFDQFETSRRAGLDVEWRVLNAQRGGDDE